MDCSDDDDASADPPAQRSTDLAPGPKPAVDILASRVGLSLPTNLTFDAWEAAGAKLFRVSDSSAWCLGDWLVFGQDRYCDRYRVTLDRVGLDYQTLRNYAWVARKFAAQRRHEGLSLQHHAEVASLAEHEQDLWLDRAEQGKWSRNRLRRELRAAVHGTEAAEAGRAVAVPRLQVPSETVGRWRAAAEQVDTDFKEWIIRALDQAAGETLGGAHPSDTLGPRASLPRAG